MTKAEKIRRKAWLQVLDQDKDYDWTFFVLIIIHKLRNMQELFATAGHHVGDKKIAKDISRLIALLERVAADDYPGDWKKSDKDKQRDLDKALKIVSEKLFHWWD